jgi:hypothetical protein
MCPATEFMYQQLQDNSAAAIDGQKRACGS